MIELSRGFLAVQFKFCVMVVRLDQGRITLRQRCTNLAEAERWIAKYG